MEIRPIGSNQTQMDRDNGTRVLFSYKTPVAAFVPGHGYIKTNQHYSKTTSGHINRWVSGKVKTVDQSEIDALTRG